MLLRLNFTIVFSFVIEVSLGHGLGYGINPLGAAARPER
jgi:hypothetical protein